MSRLEDSYTRYPRAILWLVRGGTGPIGGIGGDTDPAFAAEVGSFYLSKEPITNRQFEAFDPGHRREVTSSGDDDPVVRVSYDDARGYCEWYARISRKPMRLPTEVEWEYACRAGTRGRCFYGDREAAAYVGTAQRDRVGRLRDRKPNPFGLLGMLGGVWEWSASLYRPYPAPDDRGDPGRGPRVLRGGSFRTPLAELGCAVRRAAPPDLRCDDVGFRIARSL